MAITIDPATKVISIPKADMTLLQSVPTEIRELDMNVFRLTLKDIEDDAFGMVYDTTHNHVAPISVGGVTLARVVELINSYTVTFEDGQYAVNLTGANTNLADLVNVNQVSVRSSNSAGLVQTSEIEYSSFNEGVTIDQANGIAGQAYPIGTAERPVNNITDAKFIADLRGFDNLYVRGNLTFLVTDSLNNFDVSGQSASKTLITIPAAATITNCDFETATITGFLDGNNSLNNCNIAGLDYVDGSIINCELGSEDIVLNGALAKFIRCWSGVAGGDPNQTATIDLGGTGTDLIMRDCSGGFKLINHTSGSDAVSIDMSSGQVVLDSTITSGSYVVRGVGKVVDNSTGTATVRVEILDSQNLNRAAFSNGAVYLNSTSSNSGTVFPTGTPIKPVNNLADAITIANTEGLEIINLVGFFTATASENLDNLKVEGGSGSGNVLVLSGASTAFCYFDKIILVGTLNGLSRITNCILGVTGLGAFTEAEGRIVDCIINTAAGVTQKTAGAGTLFDNCSFLVPDNLQVAFDANGKAYSFRDCTGNILVTNSTDVEAKEIHLKGGKLELAASCTAGSAYVYGEGIVTDNSAGMAVTDKTNDAQRTVVNQGVKNASLLIPHTTDL